MAHTKAGGSTRQKGNRVGQRLGVKKFGGEKVISGNIIVRQKGSNVLPGKGTKMGRDYTIYSITSGFLKFIIKKGRQFVSVESA